jgi:hypothetical protein
MLRGLQCIERGHAVCERDDLIAGIPESRHCVSDELGIIMCYNDACRHLGIPFVGEGYAYAVAASLIITIRGSFESVRPFV